MRLRLRKTGIALLALMLAAMAMVPMVSAEETAGNSTIPDTRGGVLYPHHTIPDDYLKDSKPAQWLPESEMINIIVSQKTLDAFGQDEKKGLIEIPVAYLNLNTSFKTSEKSSSLYLEKDLESPEGVVLLRMPRQMYNSFIETSRDGKLSLPSDYFFRYYENLTDLTAHMEREGESLKFSPSEKFLLKNDFTGSGSVKNSPANSIADLEKSRISSLPGDALLLTDPSLFIQWAGSYRISSTNYDYCIGQIKPYSWSLNGAGSDLFKIFHEREYKFDSDEAIEVIAQYFDRDESAGIQIYPALYRSGAEYPISTGEWNYWGGYIPLDPNAIPHAYGYHVGFANGYYTITFEDMNTLQWVAQSQVSAASGTSSFTRIDTSSEYRQLNTPSTDTFSATTNPVIEEWARILNGGWNKPIDVWQTPVKTANMSYVSVDSQWDGWGNLVSQSSVTYP